MINTDTIKIPIKGCRKLKYFKSLGYKIIDDFIEVKIEDLNTGSREIVAVKCDYCANDVDVTYKEYLRNIKIGNKFACSKKCGSIKAKNTFVENYGVEHPLKIEEFRKKQAKTNFEKYGVEYLQQSKEIQKKTKESYLENHGVEHISKLEKNRERSKIWISSDAFKQKSKEKLFKNWGVENPSQSEEIKNTIRSNNIQKWGYDHPMKSEVIKEKLKNSFKLKYNTDNITKSEEFRKFFFSVAKDPNYISYVENGTCLFKCDNNQEHQFLIQTDNYIKRKSSNIKLCTICFPIGEASSIKELVLLEYIKSIYSGEIIKSYRDGLEIDIYLPQLKLGFEFNGLYWHSDKFKDKNYHLEKTNYFKSKNIRIIHIWEDDWTMRNDIIKSQLKNLLKLNEHRIFARKCKIEILSNNLLTTKFLNQNHLQGVDKSKIKIGLIYEYELIALMTFNKLEGRKSLGEGEWNLSRFCNKLNYNIVGGASKLLSFFISEFEPKRIISYADKDWSLGGLYESIGFKKISETAPDYKYIVDGKRKNKANFKKSKLGTSLTESLEMKNREMFRIWDCGKIKFEYQK
jgi:hypothetical protein